MQLPQPMEPDLALDMVMLERELDKAKTQAFVGSNHAFRAPLMCGMDFVWTTEIPTAATDGVTIYWNPHWFLSLPPETRKTVLIHELDHVGRLHFLRRGDRDPKRWNDAGDHEINLGLEQDNMSFKGTQPLKDSQFKGLAAEQIYDLLPESDQCAPWGPGGSEGDPQTGDMLDNPSPQKQQQIINNVVKAIHSAEAANRPGDVPGSVRELIQALMKPQVRWETYIQRWLTEKTTDDYSYRRPNRRYPDVYMPSRDGTNKLEHLAFYFDVSGSVTKEQEAAFLTEVRYIKRAFNPDKLTVVMFDTVIQWARTFEEGDELDSIEVVGRGGTCLICVRDHILNTKPTAAVIFSDLYVAPMEPIKTPVLWVAIDNKQAQVKFGQLIHVKA